jgi:hypothetical protein
MNGVSTGVSRNSKFRIPNSEFRIPNSEFRMLVKLPSDAERITVRFDDDLDVFAIAAAH